VMERVRSGGGGGGLRVHAALAGAVVVVGCQLAVRDAGVPTVHRACAVAVTAFSVSCSFCALALRLRRSWSNVSVCSLLATCCGVELALGNALRSTGDVEHHHDSAAAVPQTLLTVGVLTGAGLVCFLSPLDAVDGALVVVLVSTARYLADTLLVDVVPCPLRPLIVYAGGLAGVVAARYMERSLSQSADSGSGTSSTSSGVMVQGSQAAGAGRTSGSDVKRRRASASATNNYSSHAAARRISLPTLVHKSLVSSLLISQSQASPGFDAMRWWHETMYEIII